MNLDKLDRIVLSHDDVYKIMEWNSENRDKSSFSSVNIPMTEGLIITTGYFDLLKRVVTNALYFHINEDAIQFKLYYWDERVELTSFEMREEYYTTGKLSNVKINVGSATMDDVHTDFKSQCGLLLSIFQYINHHKHKVVEKKVTRSISKKAKHKSSSNKNRVIRLTSYEYSIDFNRNEPKRDYERQVESWRVRGHWRHYKSGKSVWIEPFVKGKGEIEPKTYKI